MVISFSHYNNNPSLHKSGLKGHIRSPLLPKSLEHTMIFPCLSLGFGRQRAKAIFDKARVASRFSSTMAMVPRAAVAATIQWTCPTTDSHYYLLVQRKNPPDAGKWCPAGGKIVLGESTLDAAKREVREETGLADCRWHENPFLTTDAIVAEDPSKAKDSYLFHYVIAHCFAKAPECSSGRAPPVVPSDDALDANWYTVEELRNLDCSDFTFQVLERAETLSDAGLLSV